MVRKLFSGILSVLDIMRRLLVNAVFVLLVLLIVAALMREKASLPEQAVLMIQPQGKLVEQIEQPSPDAFPFAFPDTHQTQVSSMVKALQWAKDDAHIQAVRLDLSDMDRTALAKLQTLRKAIEDFKQSGKPVVAAGDAFSQSQYYLAATADTVFLHPMGTLALTGFSVYRNYMHAALEKLNIDVHVFRVGNYKSAVEPFIRDDMSPADKEANQAWLGSLWQVYKQDIANMRGMDAKHIQTLLDHPATFLSQYHGNVAAMAKAEGLIDKLGDSRDADIFLASQLGWQGGGDMPAVDVKTYLKLAHPPSVKKAADKVGLIIASGPILSGEQPAGVIGSESITKLLQEAAEDEQIKALVLRIDSPGGSALASEVVRKAIARVRQVGKPVIVSMGSLAASGGYWMATESDEIWAQPTTLTGSIGVFGMVPNFTRALDKLGVHSDGVGTTALSASMRADVPLSEEMKKMIQMSVDDIYERFIGIVAQSRHMSRGDVQAVAQGRVWSGVDALRLGLVDKLGSLDDAVAAAAKRAGIASAYELQEIRAPLSLPEMIAEQVFGEADTFTNMKAAWLGSKNEVLNTPILRDILQPLHVLMQFNDPAYVYAYRAM